ncbi:MAG: hypothetical protein JWM19_6764 [Actinomycetia bacterium]|nr:hypothetical protein [Actinomycetes bacterium]
MQYMITTSALVVSALLIGLVALGIARGYNVKIALRSILMLELTRPWQLRPQPEPGPHIAIPASRDVQAVPHDQPAVDAGAIDSMENKNNETA